MKNYTSEMLERAKSAGSAEELLALAKEIGCEMTAEEADAYYAKLNPKCGELDDDDLDNVSGGGCGKTVDKFDYCENFTCIQCGSKETFYSERLFGGLYGCAGSGCALRACCANCKFVSKPDAFGNLQCRR